MTQKHDDKFEDQELAMDIIQQWKNDPVTRLEFGNDLGRYAAFRRNEDNVQVRMH